MTEKHNQAMDNKNGVDIVDETGAKKVEKLEFRLGVLGATLPMFFSLSGQLLPVILRFPASKVLLWALYSAFYWVYSYPKVRGKITPRAFLMVWPSR